MTDSWTLCTVTAAAAKAADSDVIKSVYIAQAAHVVNDDSMILTLLKCCNASKSHLYWSRKLLSTIQA